MFRDLRDFRKLGRGRGRLLCMKVMIGCQLIQVVCDSCCMQVTTGLLSLANSLTGKLCKILSDIGGT